MPGDLVYNATNINPLKRSLSEQIKALLADAKAGQEAAFSRLYDMFFDKMFRFVYYRVGHKEIAEDLTEEVFIRAFNNLSTLDDASSFESWLYQIARNRIIDYYRTKKQLLPLDDLENTLEYETNVIDVVNLELQQKTFVKLLKELSPEQQTVIKLKFFDDLSNSEIAALMDKNEGAIRVIQHRAIAKLKELIALLDEPIDQ